MGTLIMHAPEHITGTEIERRREEQRQALQRIYYDAFNAHMADLLDVLDGLDPRSGPIHESMLDI